MSAQLTLYVDVTDLAAHLRANPDALIETLTLLVDDFEDEKAVLRYCDQVANAHTGSQAEQAVAPFLQTLIERLYSVEQQMGLPT
jgi:hypothetical protein